MEGYALLLEKEIRLAAPGYRHAQVSTVFLGGGTPAIMPVKAMERVLQAVEESFSLAPGAEYTVEANPGTLTGEWLQAVCRYGVNRLSLGVQAVQSKHLKALGRIHSFEDAREAVALARGQGIHNINMDVMFGLPGQDSGEYLETLQAVAALLPKHISAYSLILEPGTPLAASVERGECAPPQEELAAEMYEQGRDWLAGQGYKQYEISNFAQEGYACKHNLGYWQGAWYLGLGLNAHSMLPPEREGDAYRRMANTPDMHVYRAALGEGKSPICQVEPIPPAEAMFETMMLGLRTCAGVREEDFLRRHGRALRAVYGEKLEDMVRDGLGRWSGGPVGAGAFGLTARGLLIQNAVLLRLM